MPESARREPEDPAGTFGPVGSVGSVPKPARPQEGCTAQEPALEAGGRAIDTPAPGVVLTGDGTLSSAARLAWRRPVAIGGGLVLELIGLKEDSRCPIGVQCVWAGRATVAVAVIKGTAEPRRLELTLPGPGANYGEHSFTLTALEPLPVAGRRTPEAELVATVAIGPAQGQR